MGHVSHGMLFGLQVQFDPDITGPRALIEAVQDAGFDAHIVDTDR